MKRFIGVVASIIFIMVLCTTCDTQKTGNKSDINNNNQVTLKILHYQNEAQKPLVNIFKKFMQENPDIKIEYDLTGGDQYETLLRSRFAALESMDIVGVHPGKTDAINYARGGYLHDLTGLSFLDNIDKQFLETGEYEGKYYGLPIDSSYIVCLYNKRIFKEMNLSIPKTWNNFIDICKQLSESNITPLSLGIKDLWITQMIAYSLAATTIYRNNANFDDDMYSKKVKFNGKEWAETLEMYQQLQPYFNHDFIQTSYEQQRSLFAGETAAMMVMGTWALPLIEEENPDLEYGAFVMPGAYAGENWTCYSVGGMLAISESSKNKKEATRFLEYFMSDEIYYQFLSSSCNLPIKSGIAVDYHPVLSAVESQVNGTYRFANQAWPNGVQNVFIRGIREMFAGKPINEILEKCDTEWDLRQNIDE